MSNLESIAIKNDNGTPQIIINGELQDSKNITGVSIDLDSDNMWTVKKFVRYKKFRLPLHKIDLNINKIVTEKYQIKKSR